MDLVLPNEKSGVSKNVEGKDCVLAYGAGLSVARALEPVHWYRQGRRVGGKWGTASGSLRMCKN